ncbi:methylenetetrahydrofolate reductase [NAD(P)H] [Ruminobacter sp. RM87]|jgi:methylenetetrahydrofolate reductase (NADPH)|uniref:methylenetetrahydrofolate reductase [NAD(P)H] n=1 Tax=Ruminobacter sp. RM87 TaxID=1200567 RepID=UPI0004E278BC|nr:methylenetetrahydrofolate reductase [NAD(P)H] [Ruminobacter sp. RM87]
MQVAQIFKQKKPVVSFEIFPPKRDEALKSIDETLGILTELKPDFISVTFGAGGSVTNSKTVEIASKIKKNFGIEAVAHLTCLNYSKDEIIEMVNNLKANDIDNILALRGDHNPNLAPKNDFMHASDLITFVKQHSDLGISAACYPEGHPEAPSLSEDVINLKRKVDAGAQHLVSQLFFDNDIFYRFIELCKVAGINVPIEAGIMPVINKAQIERMVGLCGASLPDNLKRMLDKFADNKEALFDAGIAFATNQIIDLLAAGVDGIHIYTMNNPKVAMKICDSIKNVIASNRA